MRFNLSPNLNLKTEAEKDLNLLMALYSSATGASSIVSVSGNWFSEDSRAKNLWKVRGCGTAVAC